MKTRPVSSLPSQAIAAQLGRILASREFARAERMSRFLRYTVELALSGQADEIKEYRVGVDVFDRKHDYDPRVDPIVRVEARRLRDKLGAYYENNGRDSQTVNTGWYLSTNDIISVNDRLLATNTGMTLSRGDVLTYRRALTIPSDLTVGKVYWIGTVVDKDNVVADSVPSNNATYIPIRVKK